MTQLNTSLNWQWDYFPRRINFKKLSRPLGDRTVIRLLQFTICLSLFITTGCTKSEATYGVPEEKGEPNKVQSSGSKTKGEIKVLFLGNSHTSVGNVPGLVKKIFDSDKIVNEGKMLTYDSVSGSFLDTIAKEKWIGKKIKNGNWDFVVMQGQKISMSGKYFYSTKEAEELSRIANETGSKVIWFAEWGRQGIPGETERFHKIYDTMSKVNHDMVSPVGRCWERVLRETPKLVLHSNDGNHSNQQGACLTALALVSTMAQRDVQQLENLRFKGVSKEATELFKNAVSEQFHSDRLFREDSELGKIRNHACEKVSLSQAVKQYTSAIKEIDFDGCPNGLKSAFEKHIQAWEDAIPFFEKHSKLRGEMHDLFEKIRSFGGQEKQNLEGIEKAIWGTWGEVEKAR